MSPKVVENCFPRRVAAEEIPVAEQGQISCGGTLLLSNPVEEAASPSNREISVTQKRQAAPRFLGFFCARLSCRAATMSMTLLRTGFGGGAWRFCPLALSSISFFTSSV